MSLCDKKKGNSMKITLEINESMLSAEELKTIIEGLGLNDSENITDVLSRLSRCAFLEYKKMFLSRGLPTKADEVQQERLFFLIQGFYINSLPTEKQVSTIFQLSASKAKSLLRNTIASYRNQLRNQIFESVRIVLRSSQTDEKGNYTIALKSETIKDEINRFLMQNEPTLQKLMAIRGSAGLFFCPVDTYDYLVRSYGE